MECLIPLNQHLDSREDEKRPEQVDNPGKFLDEYGAGGNHDRPHHQRPQNPPEQYLVLVLEWDGKVGEQEGEDKNVVHAQRFFNHVAGKKLHCLESPEKMPDTQVENECESNPNRRPDQRFLQCHHMRFSMKNAEVECEHEQNKGIKGNPKPGRGNHGDRKVGGISLGWK